MDRRRMLLGMGATLGGMMGATVLPARLVHSADSLVSKENPFALGVASGYPVADSVVLWTRLAPRPFEPLGGLPAGSAIPVEWEVAADETMRNVVQRGTYYATAQWGYAVHAEPTGLEPDREYWYRFSAAGARSPIGRTRTAPRVGARVRSLRIDVASCQQYEHGYFVAYAHMLQDPPDLILHLGDYMYEASWGLKRIRSHAAPEVYTLDDYRTRYALYRGERELQDAHAACPWLVTWDDHEVENDYAGDVSEEDDEREWFLARRAAAYQAYYEHMPLPARARPYAHQMRLFAQRTFGDLLSICMLDTRQYRSPIACGTAGRRGGRAADCAELHDLARTKLGATQEAWLQTNMAASRAKWNLFGSGTVMAYVDEQPGEGGRFWTDGWNGYPAARTRLLDTAVQAQVANPIVLSGDIHSFLAARHHRTPNDPASPVVASEFTTTSISSQGANQSWLDAIRTHNPNVLYADSGHRGYLRLDFDEQRLQASLVGMRDVAQRNSGASVKARYVVEAGRPGPVRA